MYAPRPRVLVTRSPQQASALAERLRELGADPVLVPAIQTVEPTSFTALDAALANLATFHWLLFTSANAVEAFAKRANRSASSTFLPTSPSTSVSSNKASQLHRDAQQRNPRTSPPYEPRVPAANQPRIAAIGPATARALTTVGLSPDLLPPQAVAESLTQALLPYALQPDGSPTRFLLIRAEEAREHLPESLRNAGAEVTIAPAYRTIIPEGAAERLCRAITGREPVQAVTFTSSSTARNLFALLAESGCALPESVVRASIGPITSATLEELGFPPHLESPQATVEVLAEILVQYLFSVARARS